MNSSKPNIGLLTDDLHKQNPAKLNSKLAQSSHSSFILLLLFLLDNEKPRGFAAGQNFED